jgi:hypothetical protein
LGNLTPTKRRLIQNHNIKTLINSFENIPVESNLEDNVIRESPAKRRRYTCGGRLIVILMSPRMRVLPIQIVEISS